jgi:hypothetical protein
MDIFAFEPRLILFVSLSNMVCSISVTSLTLEKPKRILYKISDFLNWPHSNTDKVQKCKLGHGFLESYLFKRV